MAPTAGALIEVVAAAQIRTGDGAWIASSNGAVAIAGAATAFGSTPTARPIVGMAATPSGDGYWLVASDGGIFAFGDAVFEGSTGGMALNRPIVGMAATPSGHGYWLVASDGGIFAFGDAAFQGSTGGMALVAPIVGMAPTPSGVGYWLVASDGGVFAFGDAVFAGSAVGAAAPARSITVNPDGGGYVITGSDGHTSWFSVGARTCARWVTRCGGPTGPVSPSVPAAVPASGAVPAPAPVPAITSAASAISADIALRHGLERSARGVGPLALDPGLSDAARTWSEGMAASGFAHSGFATIAGSPAESFGGLAENIFWASGSRATSGVAHLSWMRSTIHRQNILNPGWDTIGVGTHCRADGTMFVTVLFGRSANATAPALSETVPDASPVVVTDSAGPAC